MADDKPERIRLLSEKLGSPASRVPVIDPVKPVSPDALLEPSIGARVNIGRGLQGRMESRIEDGDLLDASSQNLVHCFDRRQLEAVVRRSNFGLPRDRRPYLPRPPGALEIGRGAW